jgi:hypothetical protein
MAAANASEYCLILFQNASNPSAALNTAFTGVATSKFRLPTTFISVNLTSADVPDLKIQNVKVIPSIYLSVNGHLKHFTGAPVRETLRVWVTESLAARPVVKNSHNDVDHIDRHYFVFISKKVLKKHAKTVRTLAKLISPLRIYTGFNLTELRSHLHQPKLIRSAFVYREYGHQQHPLDLSLPLGALAHQIAAEEFPTSVICNDHSFRFITEFKIPALFYYSTGEDDRTWDMIQAAAADYSEYVMPVKVDSTKDDRCNKFARSFLGVKKAPAIRILNLTKKVRRFRFFGDIDAEHMAYFLTNYVSGNLRSFPLNQKVRKGQTIKGVPVGNFRMFKQAMDDYNHRHLVYVYDPFVPTLAADLAALKAVAARMAGSRSFKVMVIDHYQNDLDGFHANLLPLVFLILRKGKFALYEKDRVTKTGLLEHIKKHLPQIEIGGEVEIDNDL